MNKKIIILAIISILVFANIATVNAIDLQSKNIEKNDELNFEILFAICLPSPPKNNDEYEIFGVLNPAGLTESFDYVNISLVIDEEEINRYYFEDDDRFFGFFYNIWPDDEEDHKIEIIIDPDNRFPNEDKSDNTWTKEILGITYPLASYVNVEPIVGKSRSFKIDVYLRNNWNESINVRFYKIAAVSAIIQDWFSSVPEEPYFNMYTALPDYQSLLIPYKFEPYEEKILISYTWHGVMNLLMDPYNKDPRAPEGNYTVVGVTMPYYMVNGKVYTDFTSYADEDDIKTIELPAREDNIKNRFVFSNILLKMFNQTPLIQRLLNL